MIRELAGVTVGTAVVTFALTAAVRHYALRRGVLDIPNQRSSHKMPTPRGGGLAIVAALVAALWVALAFGWMPLSWFMALVGGGVLVAAIGWVDDHRSLPASVRLLVHFIAGAWAIYWTGGFSAFTFGTSIVYLGPAGNLIAVIGVVWFLNLYNFMDGIDGLAGLEAFMAGTAAAILAWLSGASHVAVVSLLIAAASAGFLFWNWSPARIFMGDIGSGFLGYVLAVTALVSESSGGPPIVMWGILLGAFVVDATTTLVRRAMHGSRLSTAHRQHAYQRAVESGRSHTQVTLAISSINVVLCILVALATLREQFTWIAVVIAGGLLAGAYWVVEHRAPMFRPDEQQSDPSRSSSIQSDL